MRERCDTAAPASKISWTLSLASVGASLAKSSRLIFPLLDALLPAAQTALLKLFLSRSSYPDNIRSGKILHYLGGR